MDGIGGRIATGGLLAVQVTSVSTYRPHLGFRRHVPPTSPDEHVTMGTNVHDRRAAPCWNAPSPRSRTTCSREAGTGGRPCSPSSAPTVSAPTSARPPSV